MADPLSIPMQTDPRLGMPDPRPTPILTAATPWQDANEIAMCVMKLIEPRLDDIAKSGAEVIGRLDTHDGQISRLAAKGTFTTAPPSLHSELGWTHVGTAAFETLCTGSADIGHVATSYAAWLRKMGVKAEGMAEAERLWSVIRPILEAGPIVRTTAACATACTSWRSAITVIGYGAKDGKAAAADLSVSLNGSAADSDWLRVVSEHTARRSRKAGKAGAADEN